MEEILNAILTEANNYQIDPAADNGLIYVLAEIKRLANEGLEML